MAWKTDFIHYVGGDAVRSNAVIRASTQSLEPGLNFVCVLRAANRKLWQELLLGLLRTPVGVPFAWLRYMPSAKFTFADD